MTLDRFVQAQATTWFDALGELRAGHKTGHWIWFVFPQIAGLGHSATARHYAIADLAEAGAYLAHPLLGARLLEACDALLGHRDRPATSILGTVDAMKLRSSATLFERAGEGTAMSRPFANVLDAFFAGARDAETIRRLDGSPP